MGEIVFFFKENLFCFVEPHVMEISWHWSIIIWFATLSDAVFVFHSVAILPGRVRHWSRPTSHTAAAFYPEQKPHSATDGLLSRFRGTARDVCVFPICTTKLGATLAAS